jgi:AraC family transcriptional regulator
MYKSFYRASLLVLTVLLVFALFGCKEKPEEKPEPAEPEMSIKKTMPATVVYLEKKGPYKETGKAMDELFALMKKKNIEFAGAPMGMYYDDPEKVKPEETKYEVMCPFKGEFAGDDELKVKEIPSQEIASTIYVGPYDMCGPTYKKLFGWMAEKKLVPAGAVIEKYLNDPKKVKPEELKTEICVPVMPMPVEEK